METPLSLAIAALVGALAGTHAAIWGMYKDSCHEGFAWRSFLRSTALGTACGVALQLILRLPLPSTSTFLLLFGLSYACERAAVELWKTFVRQEDQSKYFIPMQFSVLGEPVTSRSTRFAAGVAYIAIVCIALASIAALEVPTTFAAAIIRSALVGLASGLVVAVGGGWKDAPKEGFDLLKFFRSPMLTVVYGVLLSFVTGNYVQIAMAAIGFERATAETYKTFFGGPKPPGKFSGKPVTHPEMLRHRRYFVPAYVAISGAALVCLFMAVGL